MRLVGNDMHSGPHASGGPDSLDTVLLDPHGREMLERITRLYLVVHGRAPDPGGLRAYIGHLQAGKTLRDLAQEFIQSGEFSGKVRDGDPAKLLCRNALGTDAAGCIASAQDGLAGLVEALVLSPAAAARLPILPALYPDGVPAGEPSDYRVWLAERQPERALAGNACAISFVMPVGRRRSPWMEVAVRSVLAQLTPGSELLIAARWFDRVPYRSDPRVRVTRAPAWSGSAELFNHALAHCRGTFAVLIGPDDVLDTRASAALAAVADQADIVLSDEDAIDGHELRHSPRLGGAWDPDSIMACGWPGLLMARTVLLQQAGGMRDGVADAQQAWDLLLRASRRAGPGRIVHVPKVLASRRCVAPPPGPDEVRAVQDHLRASGQERCTVTLHRETLRVVHPLPSVPPRVSIIIATRDRAALLDRCMAGLLARTEYPDMEVVLVDNGSTEPTAVALLGRLSHDARVRIVAAPGPFNWSALNNLGVSHMTGDVAVLLNNDTDVIEPGWLRELASHAVRPDIGVVGAKLLYPDGTVQHAGIVLGRHGNALHMWRYQPGDARGYLDSLIVTREVAAVTGACLAIRREVYDRAGGCDAENLPVTWNDVDLCLRVRALGLRVIWTPHACLLHIEQASRGTDDTPENQARFKREQSLMRQRWGSALVTDPFLNRNLLPSERDLRLATDV